MKVLGVRKKGLVTLYLFCLILGLIVLIAGFFANKNNNGIPLIIVGFALLITALCMVIDIIKTPKNIILYNNDSYVLQALDYKINVKDIIDVEYKKARARHIYYKWGNVIIKTDGLIIKCKYVAECEDVAKEIYKLSIKAKEIDM